MTILKALKHKYYLILGTYPKYVVQFTDPTPTIYWYVKRAKLDFFKYPSTKNVCLFGTQYIIYRPDLCNSQASRKKA